MKDQVAVSTYLWNGCLRIEDPNIPDRGHAGSTQKFDLHTAVTRAPLTREINENVSRNVSWIPGSEKTPGGQAQSEADQLGEGSVEDMNGDAASGMRVQGWISLTDGQSNLSYPLQQQKSLEAVTTEEPDALVVANPHLSLRLGSGASSANGQTSIASTADSKTPQRYSSSFAPDHDAFREQKRDHRVESMAELAKRLSEKRIDVLAVRISLQEKRLALRQEFEASIEKDARFLQNLRTLCAAAYSDELKPIITQLDSLAAHLANSRDLIFPRQDDYNQMEDHLIQEEFELKELESRFYTSRLSTKTSPISGNDIALLEDDDLTSGSNTAAFGSITYNPKEQRYLSRLGDMDIIQERIAETYNERSRILSDQDTRNLVGKHIDSDSKSFLDSFPQTIRHLELDLEMIQKDVSRLHDALTEDKVLYAAPQFDEKLRHENESDNLLETGSHSPASEEPLLLLPNESQPRFSDSDIRDPKTDTVDMGKFINCWLLYQLKQSPLAVRFLKTLAELDKLNLDKKAFATLALRLWSEDGMVQAFARHRRSNRSVSVSFRSDKTQNANSTNLRHQRNHNSGNDLLQKSTHRHRHLSLYQSTALTV